jgi:hypothetical protein
VLRTYFCVQHGEFAMKKLSKVEQARALKRLKAFSKAQLRAKTALINEARAAEGKGWSEEHWPDGSMDAWFHRKSRDSDFLEKRGGFSRHVADLALEDPDWETKETVAVWLRKELKQLREAETKPGVAPVRRGKALSRIEISEIAIELLECLAGPKLTCLFQELLDVDRHRKSRSEVFSQIEAAAEIEAQTQLQGKPLGVREFARYMSVSPSSVTRWRRSGVFWERVEFHKSVWGEGLRDDYFEKIKATAPDATDAECFRQAFQMYIESLPERRAKYARKSTSDEASPAGQSLERGGKSIDGRT